MAATIIGLTGLEAQAQPLDLSFLLPTWDRVFTVRAGAGYKDNVTLSHTATESSPYFSSGVEAIVTRLPKDGTQLAFFFSADDRRYLDSISVDHEQLAFAQAQIKHTFEHGDEVSGAVDYFYIDQIQDVSATETNQQALRVQGHTLTGRPGVRLSFPGQFWASIEITPTRQWLAAPLGDYSEFAGLATVGRDYGHQSEISLRYEAGYRDYDSEPQLTAGGEPVPGTRRSFTMQEVRLNWRHHWDAERHWRSTTRLSYKLNNDRGDGFFDFTRLYASEQLRYRSKVWEFSVEGRVSQYFYDVQTVSASSTEKRNRTDVIFTVQVERSLTGSLRLVGAYELERALSNITVENYSANTISGSLQWSF